jgi:hypothetical protein
MADIYRNAVLTLSATLSVDVRRGIFNCTRNQAHRLNFRGEEVCVRKACNQTHEAILGHDGSTHLTDDGAAYTFPLLTRG